MGRDKKITLIRADKEIGKIWLICAFHVEKYNADYIIYTKENNPQSSNSTIIYFGKISTKNNIDYLVSINNDEELETIKNKIKELLKYSLELEQIKREKNDISQKLQIPDNLFVNNYDNIAPNSELINKPKHPREIKGNKEYRNRLKSLYNEIKELNPIDKKIPNTLYVDYYNEMGIILKSKLATLKQLWIEYQLLYNEYKKSEKNTTNHTDTNDDNNENNNDNIITNSKISDLYSDYKDLILNDEPSQLPENDLSSDFNELFDSLSKRINYINNYLDELRELKSSINNNDITLEEKQDLTNEREKLERDKKEFEEYKKAETAKLTEQKQELKIHFNKFQSLVESFDQKIKEVK